MTEFKIGDRVRLTEAIKKSGRFREEYLADVGERDAIVVDLLGGAARVEWIGSGSLYHQHWHESDDLEHAIHWGHAESEADKYTGMFRTREECIDDGTSEYGGEPFYILSGPAPDPARAISSREVISGMYLWASDNWGNVADEDWPDVAHEALAELDDFLKSWARRHAQPKFWVGVGQPERIEPKEAK